MSVKTADVYSIAAVESTDKATILIANNFSFNYSINASNINSVFTAIQEADIPAFCSSIYSTDSVSIYLPIHTAITPPYAATDKATDINPIYAAIKLPISLS